VFVGIARDADVSRYLAGVRHPSFGFMKVNGVKAAR
jgi:hypothetical protein